MLKKIIPSLSMIIMLASSCSNSEQKQQSQNNNSGSYQQGSFGYDLEFLQQYDSVIVLRDHSGNSAIIVSPKYQAKVFTSTSDGNHGESFGWVNYKAFTATPDSHMNAFGGENRFWLGPEGGRFSLFFKSGAEMVFANWKTPSAFDTEEWIVTSRTDQFVTFHKTMHLTNYKGTDLNVSVDRSVKILNKIAILKSMALSLDTSVKVVGYETNNIITNTGKNEWTESSGMPCIWMLDMFKPSSGKVIVIPFKNAAGKSFSKVATTNYFGDIPEERLKHTDDILYFKADGNSRGKIGISPVFAKPIAGSYDKKNKVLTLITYDLDTSALYLNQEWNTGKPSFSGDAMNAYNDGPLADGSQMGPFYELESVSPAALLKQGQSLSHKHAVYHFTGNEKALDAITKKLLGVSLEDIEKAF